MTTPTITTEATVSAAVRGLISRYAHALDSGDTDGIVATFCADGSSEIAGVGTFVGRDELREGYRAFTPTQPQLHLVANTVITSWSDDDATAVSNLAYLQRGESGWSIVVAGRYDDVLHRVGDTWLFHSRITSYQM